MKKVFYLLAALAVAAFSLTSCNKDDNPDSDPISIVGDWKYYGSSIGCEVPINILTQLIFKIDENTIKVYGDPRLGDELTEEYSYTRKGNTITFTPAFLGTFDTAEIIELAHPAGGISLICSVNSEYTFAPAS